jgi:predicted nucleotidyltransferase
MPNSSWNTAEASFLDAETIVATLRRAVLRLASEREDLRRVVLFGSLVTGQYAPGSDADLFLEVAHSNVAPPFRPAPFLLALSETVPLDLDLFVWTTAEVACARAEGHSFLAEVERTGVVLWQADAG